MIIKSLVLGPIQANCYILGCEKTRQALIVDPGDDPEQVVAELARLELTPSAYFHTHGHLDHVGATAPLKTRLGGEILLHEADLFLYKRAHESGLQYGIELPPTVPVDRFIKGGDVVTWGEHSGTVIETPGHSPGGVCLQFAADGEWALTGDTLFAGSIGRTDLPGGSYEELLRSIKDKLLVMPDPTIVASGHGPLSTIGDERRGNPFLRGL